MRSPTNQKGAVLLVALIMLVVFTLLALSGVNSSTASLRIAGNMQAQTEVGAAAQRALEQVLDQASNFQYASDSPPPSQLLTISSGGDRLPGDGGAAVPRRTAGGRLQRLLCGLGTQRIVLGRAGHRARSAQRRDPGGAPGGARHPEPWPSLPDLISQETSHENDSRAAACSPPSCAGPVAVLADDTDIFLTAGRHAASAPNVLIVLDNSANWSASFPGGTKFAAEMATLSNVIASLDDKFNVGLMMMDETGAGTTAPTSGSYVRFGVRNMNAVNRTWLRNMVLNIGINNDKTNNASWGFAMFEAYKYFGGGSGSPQDPTHFGNSAYSGFGQPKRDFPEQPADQHGGRVARQRLREQH